MRNRDSLADTASGALVALAVLLLLLEEGAAAWASSWDLRRALALSGFILDAFFVSEFGLKLGISIHDGRAKAYLSRELGWVDLLGSLPVLALLSGPFFFASLSGRFSAPGSAAIALCLFFDGLRSIRLLRALRLLRFAAASRAGSGSPSAGRHVTSAALLAAAALLGAVAVLEVAGRLGFASAADGTASARREASIAALAGGSSAREAALHDQSLLLAIRSGRTESALDGAEALLDGLGPDRLRFASRNGVEAYFSDEAASRSRAAVFLAFALIFASVLLALILGYGPAFEAGVSLPLSASIAYLRGDEDRVRFDAPPGREEEEPFLLAELLDDYALSGEEPVGDAASCAAARNPGSAYEAPIARGRAFDTPGAQDPEPLATRAEIEGLLARAAFVDGGGPGNVARGVVRG